MNVALNLRIGKYLRIFRGERGGVRLLSHHALAGREEAREAVARGNRRQLIIAQSAPPLEVGGLDGDAIKLFL